MKRTSFTISVVGIIGILLLSISCAEKAVVDEKPTKITNTFKSVSLFQDSIPIEPKVLLKVLTIMNEAIDSIGYPDAGYKLWEVTEDSLDFRFMIEGYWPDKETYKLIHDHELYADASKEAKTLMEGIKSTWYHQFSRIK